MTFPVASYDVGQDSLLTLSALLRLQQEAGERHFLCGGLGFTALAEHGMAFVVLQASAVFTRRPAMGEEIALETWCLPNKGVRFLRAYRVLNDGGSPLIESVSSFALVRTTDHSPLRPCALDAFHIPPPPGYPIGCPEPKRLSPPSDLSPVGEFTVRRSHLDFLGHFNNSRYADLIDDFSPVPLTGDTVGAFTLSFRREAKLGETLAIATGQDGERLFLRGDHARGVCFEAEVRLRPSDLSLS